MVKTKKKSPKTTSVPEDVKWCRMNSKTLTPRMYFEHFKIANRQIAHCRYKKIIDTYISKKQRKILKSNFELWRNSVECENYWLNTRREITQISASSRAAEFTHNVIEDEFDILNKSTNAHLANQEIAIDEENEEDSEEGEEEEGEEKQGEKAKRVAMERDEFHESHFDENDDSFTSFLSTDKHPNAETYYNCLSGHGSHEWLIDAKPSVTIQDWIAGDTNITKYLKKVRSESMKAAEQLERISSIRILSLSHIFVISPCTNESIGGLLPQINDLLLCSTDILKKIITPDATVVWANKIVNSDYTNQVQLQRLFLTLKAEALTFSDPSYLTHIDYLEDFTKFYRPSNSNDTEDNAVDRLKQLMRHIFSKNTYIINANTKHLEDAEAYIPDFKVSIEGKSKKQYDVFIIESKLSERAYFPDKDDFIKLRLELQVMLNVLIDNNVSNPKVFGMLSKGLKCKIYIMWLEYDGQYICREVKSFTLPESIDQILLCPSILCTMMAIEEKIDLLVNNIIHKKKGKSPLASLKRVGFNSPVLVSAPITSSIEGSQD